MLIPPDANPSKINTQETDSAVDQANDTEARTEAIKVVQQALHEGREPDIRNFRDLVKFNFSIPELKELGLYEEVTRMLKADISRGYIDGIEQDIRILGIDQHELLANEECINLAVEAVMYLTKTGNLWAAGELLSYFKLEDSPLLKTRYNQGHLVHNILISVSRGQYKESRVFEGVLPPGFFESNQFKNTVAGYARDIIKSSVGYRTLEPPAFERLMELKRDYDLSDEQLPMAEIRELAHRSIWELLTSAGRSDTDIWNAVEIKGIVGLEDDWFRSIVQHVIMSELLGGGCAKIITLVEYLRLPESTYRSKVILDQIPKIPLASLTVILSSESMLRLYPEAEERRSVLYAALQIDEEDNSMPADERENIGELKSQFWHSLPYYKNLPAGIAYSLVRTAPYWFPPRIVASLHSFEGIDPDVMLPLLLDADVSQAAIYNEMIGSPNKLLAFAYEVLGDYVSREGFELIARVSQGTASQWDLKECGITQQGEAGLVQIRESLRKFKAEILSEDLPIVKRLHQPLFASYFLSYVRFSESQFNYHEEDDLRAAMETYNEFKQMGLIAPLPEHYHESGEVLIDKVDRQAQNQFQYSEQFSARYNVLKNSLKTANELIHSRKPLSALVEAAEAKRLKIVAELETRLGTLDNPKAIDSLTKRLDSLKAVNLRSLEAFRDNFVVLAQFKEFEEELRAVTFLVALRKHPREQAVARRIVQSPNPTIADISSMIDLIDHIINQETWKDYFANHHAAKDFATITNIRALQEELARAQNQSTKGKVSLQFVPTRGPLLEMSGHIADACWSSQVGAIGKDYQNFVAVTMVQNRGTKHERLVGSCLLIETESEDGVPLIIIRGLNPIQNLINGLSVEDFYRQFTSYVQQIADKSDRKAAIVIDDQSGRAATNRPALFAHLEQQKKHLENIVPRSGWDMNFNGYNIREDTYLVEPV